MPSSQDLDHRPRKSILRIGLVTCCMMGLEFTWVVVLDSTCRYGTPYLLSLGLSKEITALIWISGPISGLIVQPIVGVWSDNYKSKLGRRRPFIIIGGVIVWVSLVGLGYAEPIVRSLASSSGDKTVIQSLKVAVTISSLYALQVGANIIGPSSRSLFIDMFPTSQQNTVNVFSSVFFTVADVAGYLLGYLKLSDFFPVSDVSQMGALCTITAMVSAFTIVIVCLSAQEAPLSFDITSTTKNEPWYQIFIDIWNAIRHLPYSIQKLCNAQFFGWMYWFQFATYITTWVAEIYSKSHPSEKWDEGARMGSLAVGISAVVSIASGTILPSAIKHGFLSRKNMYTLSHILFAAAMFLVPFIHSLPGAIMLCSLVGVPWMITMWVPYSLISEYLILEQYKEKQHPCYDYRSSSQIEEESTPLLPVEKKGIDTGIVLGIHNIYMTLPQFISIAVTAIIFSMAHSLEQQNPSDNQGVSWVLQSCGVMAIVAAIVSRRMVEVD